jgi:hypothetical protein
MIRCDFCVVYVVNSWDYCGWLELWDFSITMSNLGFNFFFFFVDMIMGGSRLRPKAFN